MGGGGGRTGLAGQVKRLLPVSCFLLVSIGHLPCSQCQYWLDEARRLTNTGVRIVALVGNKCDDAENRVVTTRMASKFAEANAMLFFETSTRSEDAKDKVSHSYVLGCMYCRSLFFVTVH